MEDSVFNGILDDTALTFLFFCGIFTGVIVCFIWNSFRESLKEKK
jgi:hypothetical protein